MRDVSVVNQLVSIAVLFKFWLSSGNMCWLIAMQLWVVDFVTVLVEAEISIRTSLK